MIDRNDGADTDGDTECGQNGIDHMNGTGEVISVEKVADRRSERDSGDERHDVSDDDLIVEDWGTKGEHNQRQQRYECTSQDIRDKLGILMAL